MGKEMEDTFWAGVIMGPIFVAFIVATVLFRGWVISVVWGWTATLIWGASPLTVAQGIGVSALAALVGRGSSPIYKGAADDAHKRNHIAEMFTHVGALLLIMLIAYIAMHYYPEVSPS